MNRLLTIPWLLALSLKGKKKTHYNLVTDCWPPTTFYCQKAKKWLMVRVDNHISETRNTSFLFFLRELVGEHRQAGEAQGNRHTGWGEGGMQSPLFWKTVLVIFWARCSWFRQQCSISGSRRAQELWSAILVHKVSWFQHMHLSIMYFLGVQEGHHPPKSEGASLPLLWAVGCHKGKLEYN